MTSKDNLIEWTMEALASLGGAAHHVEVAKHIWHHHEEDLRAAGDLFYTWQYDLRWAAFKLRERDRLQPAGRDGVWRVTPDWS